jgi:subtilase family serine protease
VLVSVAIPLRNLPLLSSLVQQESNPRSSGFRHFLSYSQVSQLFLPTQSQYQSVLDYLTSLGFTVQSSSLNSMITVRGTAGMVDQNLGQSVQLYTNGTYSYYQTTGSSSIPGAYSFASNSSGLLIRPDYVITPTARAGSIPSSNVTFTEGGQQTKLLQTVYNSTGLISKGENGTGYSVGLLDFYGYSRVNQDLAQYDSTYGYPAPPSFSVVPIGPYNPNLGTPLGWDGEIDLDVQVSHAMAPGASITLYAANGALSLSAAIAQVVQYDKVNVLSQSFGLPEWEYYESGAMSYLFNSVFVDDYYMLGSSMGMTFLASSGDGGGSGFSAGPQGGAEYPASSPYVTSLGGTSTYVSTRADGTLSVNQSGWSNLGFAPYFVNEGGSGGGVSILEPKPWFQSPLPAPASFPNGRMTPDLSLDASGTPGTLVIYHGAPTPIGGTSEASPLFAGLATLLMGAEKGHLGLLNPVLYQMGANPQTYSKAYDPISFGYTIPWVSSPGYNLVTGWGAPNIGEMARLYAAANSSSSLSVDVGITNPGSANYTDYLPGQSISVVANIVTTSGGAVKTGSFSASLQTLGGSSAPIALTLDPNCNASPPILDCWTGSIPVANESGIANVVVTGNSSGQSGAGSAPAFVGYLANFIQPLAPYPWSYLPGLETAVSITDLSGKTAPFAQTQIAFQNYSIIGNRYSTEANAVLNYSASSGYYQATLTMNLTSGPTALVTLGPVAGYLPFVSGISLLGTDIYPEVVAEPGSVAPGQSLTIVASITAPENIYLTQSLSTGQTLGTTIAEGANVTATLVDPAGKSVATALIPEQTCSQALKVCGASLTLINGYLPVPLNATSGMYTVMLNARYNDETTGFNYTGAYFGQVYVSTGVSTPKISVSPSTLFEGEPAVIMANITDASGKEVTNGIYSAFIYPASAQTDYSSLMHSTYSADGLLPLRFDPKLGLWTGNATMPSPYNSSSAVTNSNADYYGGPYDVYVSGLSAGGVPTNAELSAQQAFFVQPYVWTADTVIDNPGQTSRLALSNVTISAGPAPLTLTDDYFIGNNTVTGSNVTIATSSVSGTLNLGGGRTALSGVTGGNIIVTGASLVVERSDLASLSLRNGATASIDASSNSLSISPSLPVVTISAPSANESYTGKLDAQVTVSGQGVSQLIFSLDGRVLSSLAGQNVTGGTFSYPIDTTAIPDGTHQLLVTAVQSDHLSSASSVSFVTDNQLATATNSLRAANHTIDSLSGNLKTANDNITGLQSTVNNLTYLLYIVAAVAIVGVAIAIYSVRAGKKPWKY